MIFMRPICLLLLVIPFILHFIVKHKALDNTWKKYVSASLLKHLTVSHGKASSQFLLIGFCWSMLSLALAGPCFDKISTPQIQALSSTVIILDLNTITPSQLPRVKAKLLDLVDNLTKDKIALVLYDEKGYTALPLTQDKEIIRQMIPVLNQSVLPQIGNDTKAGFLEAFRLLKNEETTMGRILFITGGAPVSEVLPLLKQENVNVGVLGIEQNQSMGPEPLRLPNGSLLRNKDGQVLFAQLNQQELSKLGSFVKMSSTNQDIDELLNKTQPTQKPVFNQKNSLLTMPSWRDVGVYLVLMTMPFIALFFRKGVLFLWLILISFNAQANMWLRPDQVNYQTAQKGVEAYHLGDYDKALDYFVNASKTPNMLYNQANVLAHQQKIQEALALYQQVLDKDPTHENARFNKKYLEDQLKSSQQNQSQGQNQNNDQNKNQDNAQKQGDNQDSEKNQNAENSQSTDQSDENQSNDNLSHESQSSQNSQEQKSQNESQNQANQLDERQESQYNNDSQLNEENNQDLKDQKTDQNQSSVSSDQQETRSNNESQTNPLDAEQQPEKLSQQKSRMPQQKNDESQSKELGETVKNQQAQEIYNRLKKDPARLLRYRLYEQNRRKNHVSD